jgi:hypothetical protein
MKKHLTDLHKVDINHDSPLHENFFDQKPNLKQPKLNFDFSKKKNDIKTLGKTFAINNICNQVADNELFKSTFKESLPSTFNSKLVVEGKIDAAKEEVDKTIIKLNKQTVSLLIDSTVIKNQSREFFNFILNDEFIESVEHCGNETKENMVSFIHPKIINYEKIYKCLIININTDNTNKATAPIKEICNIDKFRIMTTCITHSSALAWKDLLVNNEKMKEIISRINLITKIIRNTKTGRIEWKKHCKIKLLKFSVCKWMSFLLMIQRFLDVEKIK